MLLLLLKQLRQNQLRETRKMLTKFSAGIRAENS